jgi:hypothetical protein
MLSVILLELILVRIMMYVFTNRGFYFFAVNVMVKWLATLVCVQEVMDLYLSSENDYPD